MSTTPAIRVETSERSAARTLAMLVATAQAAGKIALPFFRPGEQTTADIRMKAGDSPVTEADMLADAYLRKTLTAALPAAAWLSEESADDAARLSARDVLIVDPIDGTRGFIAGDLRWTVCVALVRDGRPIAGVVHAPANDETFSAMLGGGAWLNGKRLIVSKQQGLAGAKMAGPRHLLDAAHAGVKEIIWRTKIPSLAYRMAMVASGALDAALASTKAHDWDIAAVDLIVREAGGVFCGLDGSPLAYNKADITHPVLLACAPQLFAEVAGAAGAHN